jgi:hypothetical protein
MTGKYLLLVVTAAVVIDGQDFDNFLRNDDGATRRRCWSSGNDQPAKWWPEKSRIDRGRYWYECVAGQLEPRGCFDDRKNRLNVNENFVQNGYEMSCVLDTDGYLSFKITACAPDDGSRRYQPGESWNSVNNKFWSQCIRDGPYYLRIETGGCITADGQRIDMNRQLAENEIVWECQRKWDGSVSMCAVGCMHKDRKYFIGDSWNDGDFVYYCRIENGRTQKVCIGCLHRNRRLSDGDRYLKDDVVYQCTVRPDKFLHEAVGCVEDDSGSRVQRVIGCRWDDGPHGDYKYEYICEESEDGKSTIKKPVACVKQDNGVDILMVRPEKYTIWFDRKRKDNVAYACRKEYGRLRMSTFRPEEVAWKTNGLTYSVPNS